MKKLQQTLMRNIEVSTYKKWKNVYNNELNGLKIDKERLSAKSLAKQAAILELLPNLIDINWLFSKMTIPEKQEILSLIGVRSNWTNTKHGYRIPSVYSPFVHKLQDFI